jgi:predicted DNA-binding ribbon-helix-helix protein
VTSAKKDARALVQAVQEESEATRGQPLPEGVRAERRGGSVVQSVRLPAEDFEDIEQIAARAKVPVSALIRGWILAELAAERGTSLRDAIDHLAEEAQRLRRLAAVSDVA